MVFPFFLSQPRYSTKPQPVLYISGGEHDCEGFWKPRSQILWLALQTPDTLEYDCNGI